MRVTDEMVEAAIREWALHTGVKAVPFQMRPTLEAALAAAPQAEPVAKVVQTAPARIWLQVSDDLEHEDEPFPRGSLASEVTWSEDSVMDVEVQYVRADLVMPQPAPPQAAEPSEAQDAARYRWLRDWPLSRWEIRYWTGQWWETMRCNAMDAAVDEALRAAAAARGQR